MENPFFLFVIIGFLAQIIDGALGMGYGVISTSVLLSFGVPPVTASASVHAAEVVTTGISGFSHFKLGNVDRGLFKRLLLPGVIGAVIGAYVLTTLPGEKIKPFISAYLLLVGLLILWRAFKSLQITENRSQLSILGFAGGLMDAIGGGGWGPIVTSTLVARGNHPRYTIGSVNLSEFFVSLAISITFVLTIGLQHWQVILGLTLGGGIAAPLAAVVCKRLPAQKLMLLVGILIILLSARTLWLTLAPVL